MKVRQPRYSKEEFARQAIYEQQVRAQVEEGNRGKIVAIDIETGEFEVADDPLAASDQLFARCPDAQPWLIRIGHRALHRFGQSHAGICQLAPLRMIGQAEFPDSEHHKNALHNRNYPQHTYGIAKNDQY